MFSSTKTGLVECQGLNTDELAEIQQLARLCNEHDELDLKLNWNVLRARPRDQRNDFLYYIDGQLVGFLALFAFNAREGEISGMVHPAYRRLGLFSALFAAVGREARSRKLSSLLLIAEQSSPAGQAFVRHLAVVYDHSEYKMVLQEPRLPAHFSERLRFRLARSEDLQSMTQITALAFGMSGDEVTWYTDQTLARSNARYFVGEIDGEVIGKLDVILSDGAGLIIGFAVHPAYQGQGYGRQILARTVQVLLKENRSRIWLEVATENKQALALYQSCGFTETGSYDYYRFALLSLQGQVDLDTASAP